MYWRIRRETGRLFIISRDNGINEWKPGRDGALFRISSLQIFGQLIVVRFVIQGRGKCLEKVTLLTDMFYILNYIYINL